MCPSPVTGLVQRGDVDRSLWEFISLTRFEPNLDVEGECSFIHSI